MNDTKIEQYFYLLKRFTEEEQDAAKDGLMEACNTLTPEQDTQAYVFLVMKNRVIDYHRKQKRSTMTPELEKNKKIDTTKPSFDGRRPTKIVGDFSKFYNIWLFENDLSDSLKNRQKAYEVFEFLKDPSPIREVPLNEKEGAVSLDALMYQQTNNVGVKTYLDNLPDLSPNPEKEILINEEREELVALRRLKNDKLRIYLYRFLPKDVDPGSEEIKAAYKNALLTIIASVKNWKDVFMVCDIHIICQLCGLKTDYVCRKLMPSQAASALKELEVL